jgi:UPF0176 protein
MMKHDILLYYKYTSIKNPEKFALGHRVLCESLSLKGRVIVASEGINATVEGLKKNIKTYIKTMSAKRGFSNVHWKVSDGTGEAFPRLTVKVRPEIVSLGLSKKADVDPRKTTGIHLDPKKLHEWFRKGEEFHIVDMRNNYEHKVGHFKDSILPPLANFRDLPKVLPTLKHLKNKKVLTVCTGGVRCEKASGYLVKKGFKDVYQLDGGIVSYMKKYPGKDFLGSLYVFDGRVTMAYNPKKGERPVIGKCEKCGVKTETYADCTHVNCKTQILCCRDCAAKDLGFCGEECVQIVASNPKLRSESVLK